MTSCSTRGSSYRGRTGVSGKTLLNGVSVNDNFIVERWGETEVDLSSHPWTRFLLFVYVYCRLFDVLPDCVLSLTQRERVREREILFSP